MLWAFRGPIVLQAGTNCACFLRRKSEVYSRLQYITTNSRAGWFPAWRHEQT